jgi:hypothetical protein
MKKLLFNFLFLHHFYLQINMFKHIILLIDLQKGKLIYQNSLATENPGKIKGFYIKTLFWMETCARNGNITQSKMGK